LSRGRRLDPRAATSNQNVGTHRGGLGQKCCCVTGKAREKRAREVSGVVRKGSPKARLRDAAMGLDGSRRHLGQGRQPREAAGCLPGIRLCPTVCLGCQRMSGGTLFASVTRCSGRRHLDAGRWFRLGRNHAHEAGQSGALAGGWHHVGARAVTRKGVLDKERRRRE
jgi:hypothetical protein